MITAGIDIGAKTIKVVLLREPHEVISRDLAVSGFDQRTATETLFSDALKYAGFTRTDIAHISVTGAGRKDVPFANSELTEVSAGAKGATFLVPTARTVIDVGAEEGRGMRCDATGKIIDFAINEKCAAGAGAFTEAMARALELNVEEFGRLSLKSERSIPMNAQCAVFAESEVVSLIHAKTPKEDIARAVHDAIASRIASMVRRVGIEKDVVLIGGVAKNPGFVDALKRDLNVDIIVPEFPEFVGAFGAALQAMKNITSTTDNPRNKIYNP
jgi:benzoyl-CoA reductase subunit D